MRKRTEPEFTHFTSRPGHDKGDVSSTTLAYQLSGPLTALVGSAFVSGVIYGLLEFLQRSPIRREHVAGSAAWGQQLALALGTIVILSAESRGHLVSVAKPRSLADCYSRFLLPRCSCSASGGQASR
jgi:hypothetical protein